MKRIGILGGATWHSTAAYYRIINETIAASESGCASADLVMRSVEFAEFERLQEADQWETVADRIAGDLRLLETAGAELLGIACNTWHRDFERVTEGLYTPVLHIADAVRVALHRAGVARVGLLGTRYTVEGGFLAQRLEARGVSVQTGKAERVAELHQVIFDELSSGQVTEAGRDCLERACDEFAEGGAQAVVLACSELQMLVDGESRLPLFDTTRLHAEALAHAALSGS